MILSVITVTYNAKDFILSQIKTVQEAAQGLTFEHFIVDNGSQDSTVALIEKNFPLVKIIKNKDNQGFAAANNQAAALAQGDFLLFLNPDMKLEAGSLSKLLNWAAKHPKAGLTGCQLLDNAGKVNLDATPRRLPTVLNQLVVIFKLHHIWPGVLNHYLYRGYDWHKEQEVESVRGSFMLLKREIYDKLGWAFDPRYFIWFEDVDLCREVKKMGYQVVFTPVVSALDMVGQSFKKQNKVWKQKQFTRSMVKYFKKWESWYKWIWVWLARPAGILLVYLSGKNKTKDYL